MTSANGAAKKTPAEIAAQVQALASGEVLRRFPRVREHGVLTAESYATVAAAEIHYEWQGIATDGNIVALVGHPGDGKTTLLYALLAARASVTDRRAVVLGRELLPAPRDKVIVLVQEEVSRKLSDRKLDEALRLWGMSPEAKHGRVLSLVQTGEKLGGALWGEVARMVREGLVDSIWVDSLARVQPVDSDSEEDQAKVFAYLQAIVKDSPGDRKPTVWITAHPRKGATGESIGDISGSHQRGAQIDVGLWVQLERDGKRIVGSRSHFLKIREAEGDYPDPCSFSLVRSPSGDVAAKWSTAEGEVGRAPISTDEVLAVFVQMRDRGVDGLSIASVCRELARNRGATGKDSKADSRTVRKLVDTLVADGKVSACQIAQRKGDPFNGYRLGAEGGTVAGAVPASERLEDVELA